MWWPETRLVWEEGFPESLASLKCWIQAHHSKRFKLIIPEDHLTLPDSVSIHDIPSGHGIRLGYSVSNDICTFLQLRFNDMKMKLTYITPYQLPIYQTRSHMGRLWLLRNDLGDKVCIHFTCNQYLSIMRWSQGFGRILWWKCEDVEPRPRELGDQSGWQYGPSRWWVRTTSHCFGSQSSTRNSCTCHVQSVDWGVPNLNSPGLAQLRVLQKVDRMHWPRVIERARAKGEGGRKPAGVREQGASCPQLRYMKVFRYVSKKVGLAALLRCLLSQCLKTYFHFSNTHYFTYARQAFIDVIMLNGLNVFSSCSEDEMQQSKPHIKAQRKRGQIMSVTWLHGSTASRG